MAFHATDGWFFRRNADGSVTIAFVPPPHAHMFLADGADDAAINASPSQVTLSPEVWASVVASVSKGGEVDERFYVAQRFHESTGRVSGFKETSSD